MDMFEAHYSSELFKHMADLLSNTKLLGNPTKIFSNLVEVWVSSFKENKSHENDPFSKKIFKESFITLFQAHSKANGNFEMNYYQHLMKPDDLKKYAGVTRNWAVVENNRKLTWTEVFSMQTGKLIHALYSVPFASHLMPTNSRGLPRLRPRQPSRHCRTWPRASR